ARAAMPCSRQFPMGVGRSADVLRDRAGAVLETAGLPRRGPVPCVADGGDRRCPQPSRCFCGRLADSLRLKAWAGEGVNSVTLVCRSWADVPPARYPFGEGAQLASDGLERRV